MAWEFPGHPCVLPSGEEMATRQRMTPAIKRLALRFHREWTIIGEIVDNNDIPRECIDLSAKAYKFVGDLVYVLPNLPTAEWYWHQIE